MEFCQPADRMEVGRITCNSKHACDRKVEWLSMEGKVPSGRGEFRPVEVPPVTVEAGSPFRKIGDEVTVHCKNNEEDLRKVVFQVEIEYLLGSLSEVQHKFDIKRKGNANTEGYSPHCVLNFIHYVHESVQIFHEYSYHQRLLRGSLA